MMKSSTIPRSFTKSSIYAFAIVLKRLASFSDKKYILYLSLCCCSGCVWWCEKMYKRKCGFSLGLSLSLSYLLH